MIKQIIAQVKATHVASRNEYMAFRAAIAHLPRHEQAEMLQARKKQADEGRKFRTDERRHREVVAAIRSTSFWRFGS